MSSGRGAGRGALFRQLLATQGSASSTESTSSPQAVDSGIGKSSSPTISGGRGKIREETSSSSDSASLTTGGTALAGRARLIQSLRSSQSTSSHEDSLLAKPAVIRGRGQIMAAREQAAPEQVEQVKELEESMAELPIAEEPQAVIRRGSRGRPVNALCNYVRLKSDPNKGVYEYEVRFQPSVDSRNARFRYLNEHRDIIGMTKTFDGVVLFLPIQLPNKVTILHSQNPVDNTRIEIKVTYKRKKPLRECIHLYNILFDRIMKILNYIRFDRKQYDPTAPKVIPQHKLEVWPGYVTAIDEYEDGVMLCCDVAHKLLCQTTVLDTLKQAHRANPQMFQENAKKALIGAIVLTRYNNRTYRIDDIDFSSNPLCKFKTRTSEISYIDYYKTQYNMEITDPKQPLLISIKKQRVANKETPEEIVFCLIPEICNLTGVSDALRSDYKVMRDIATFTQVTPNQRVAALEKFCRNVNNCKEAREILYNWGFTLEETPLRLVARQLEEETIYFAKRQFPAGENADFGRHAANNELLEVVNITSWLLIHTRNDMRYAKSFLEFVEKNSRPMGILVGCPKIIVLDNERTEAYVKALRENITAETQIVTIICPTSRDDRYAAIKKVCCTEIPVPSQVINARTLGNENKNRSVVQKILLQMNCKLGGTLWSVRIPLQKVMICGVDAYHEANQQGKSVAAFVASLNSNFTKWCSRAVIQPKKSEIVNGLCASLKLALKTYLKVNGYLPEKIIIFRDGVGDGQLKLCSEYEIPQFENACTQEHSDYNPTITFIVVQKRINTRLFLNENGTIKNPSPGFVLDHSVTRKYLYDFFLISQSVRQGTVSPTHYVVLQDSANFSPDILQRLSYKLTFMYYNWPGTVRVPACCQYAHKLAYLVGQSIKRETSEKLADKLFYL